MDKRKVLILCEFAENATKIASTLGKRHYLQDESYYIEQDDCQFVIINVPKEKLSLQKELGQGAKIEDVNVKLTGDNLLMEQLEKEADNTSEVMIFGINPSTSPLYVKLMDWMSSLNSEIVMSTVMMAAIGDGMEQNRVVHHSRESVTEASQLVSLKIAFDLCISRTVNSHIDCTFGDHIEVLLKLETLVATLTAHNCCINNEKTMERNVQGTENSRIELTANGVKFSSEEFVSQEQFQAIEMTDQRVSVKEISANSRCDAPTKPFNCEELIVKLFVTVKLPYEEIITSLLSLFAKGMITNPIASPSKYAGNPREILKVASEVHPNDHIQLTRENFDPDAAVSAVRPLKLQNESQLSAAEAEIFKVIKGNFISSLRMPKAILETKVKITYGNLIFTGGASHSHPFCYGDTFQAENMKLFKQNTTESNFNDVSEVMKTVFPLMRSCLVNLDDLSTILKDVSSLGFKFENNKAHSTKNMSKGIGRWLKLCGFSIDNLSSLREAINTEGESSSRKLTEVIDHVSTIKFFDMAMNARALRKSEANDLKKEEEIIEKNSQLVLRAIIEGRKPVATSTPVREANSVSWSISSNSTLTSSLTRSFPNSTSSRQESGIWGYFGNFSRTVRSSATKETDEKVKKYLSDWRVRTLLENPEFDAKGADDCHRLVPIDSLLPSQMPKLACYFCLKDGKTVNMPVKRKSSNQCLFYRCQNKQHDINNGTFIDCFEILGKFVKIPS